MTLPPVINEQLESRKIDFPIPLIQEIFETIVNHENYSGVRQYNVMLRLTHEEWQDLMPFTEYLRVEYENPCIFGCRLNSFPKNSIVKLFIGEIHIKLPTFYRDRGQYVELSGHDKIILLDIS